MARCAAATASWIVRAIILQAAAVFLLDEFLGVEVGDFAGEANRQRGSVERRDGMDAAPAFLKGTPERGRRPGRWG